MLTFFKWWFRFQIAVFALSLPMHLLIQSWGSAVYDGAMLALSVYILRDVMQTMQETSELTKRYT